MQIDNINLLTIKKIMFVSVSVLSIWAILRP
jgi:hypothetical protein